MELLGRPARCRVLYPPIRLQARATLNCFSLSTDIPPDEEGEVQNLLGIGDTTIKHTPEYVFVVFVTFQAHAIVFT